MSAQTGTIIVELGIDSAGYQDDNTINLAAYATAVGERVRAEYPDLRFSFSATEDDNAETTITWNDDTIDFELGHEIAAAIRDAESIEYPDEGNWNEPPA